jgi:uncharacterized membrane protein YbaN (DUF454 family)
MIIRQLVNTFATLPVYVQRYLRLTAGWLCIGCGFIGLILPLLPGIPFLLLGSWLLGWDSWLRPWLAKWFPNLHGTLLQSSRPSGGT